MSINGMMFDYTTIIVLVKVLSDWQRDNRFIHGRFPYGNQSFEHSSSDGCL